MEKVELKNNECINKIIKSIKKGEAAVFCGAGISYHSGVPLSKQFMDYVLNKLEVSKEDKKLIMKALFPFEAFIETLSGDCKIDRLLDIFDKEQPNTNHILLAKLAKKNYIKLICTTNFDQLIEKALEREGLEKSKHYSVHYNENEFSKIDWNEDKLKIVKIHGSIENKKNMGIVLKRVSAKSLSEKRYNVINNIFSSGKHKNVLVFGYSCSDVFDLCPQIESLDNNLKNVFFVDHLNTNHNSFKVQDITKKIKKNPFQHFSGSKHLLVNTDQFVKTIWQRCLKDKYKFITGSEYDTWKDIVDTWAIQSLRRNSEATKFNITGILLNRISEFSKAINFLEQGLKIAEQEDNSISKACVLGNLGGIYRSIGKYKKSIEYHKKALSIAREEGSSYGEMLELNNLGIVYRKIGNMLMSLNSLNDAVGISKELGNKEDEANTLNNLGNTHQNLGNISNAVDCYRKAIHLSREVGDKRIEGKSLSNLGNAFFKLGNNEEALKFHLQSLEIARLLGDKESEGSSFGNIASVLVALGQHKKAIKHYNDALTISKQNKDMESEANYLGGLSNVYLAQKDYETALMYLRMSLDIFKELGNKHGEAQCLGNIGIVYGSLGKFKDALENHEKTLDIYLQLDDKLNLGNSHINVAADFQRLGNHEKAAYHLKSAYNYLAHILPPTHPKLEQLKHFI